VLIRSHISLVSGHVSLFNDPNANLAVLDCSGRATMAGRNCNPWSGKFGSYFACFLALLPWRQAIKTMDLLIILWFYAV
jgi:hypothetical protein